MKKYFEKPLTDKEFQNLEPQQHDGNKLENVGLAISGGGIRSATFALGVIQSLAKAKRLKDISYLSTVSGGGYIGTWLNLWIQREADGLAAVTPRLVPSPEGTFPQDGSGAEEPQIGWLRKYSNFLAPTTGLFSADTWLIFTIWFRNTLLNLLVLIPFLAALLLAPWTYLSYMVRHFDVFGVSDPRVLLLVSLLLLILSAVSYRVLRKVGLLRGVIPALFVCAFAVLFTRSFVQEFPCTNSPIIIEGMECFVIAAGLITALLCCYGMFTNKSCTKLSLYSRSIVCAIVSSSSLLGVYYIATLFLRFHHRDVLSLILSAPLVSGACSIILILIIGTLGPLTRDEDREGLSRVTAWIGIFSIAGLLLGGITLFGPVLLAFLYQAGSILYATGGLWLLISGFGAYLAQSASTSGKDPSRASFLEKLLPLSSYVFVFGMLFLVSLGIHLALSRKANISALWDALKEKPEIVYCDACREEAAPISWGPLWRKVSEAMTKDALVIPFAAPPATSFFYCLLTFLVLSRFLHINEFSMFSFYRNRLVRAYCAASRTDRENQDDFIPFTNLAHCDDSPLKTRPESNPLPFTHLINTAANISLEETGLAERRAVSFVFTPYGCGYRLPSGSGDAVSDQTSFYRSFESPESSTSYGTAMTISGAAASPNMGFHTSPVLGFLMTIFNVRLGYWFWNPLKEAWLSTKLFYFSEWLMQSDETIKALGFYKVLKQNGKKLRKRFKAKTKEDQSNKPDEDPKAKATPKISYFNWQPILEFLRKKSLWRPKGPKWGTLYFLSELFALANKRRKYIYLSDGGHFENLGVYELLARRVNYIICIDGEQDPNLKFESLGALVRKAQQDFGIRIRIDTSDIEERTEVGWSRSHCTVGLIDYPRATEATEATEQAYLVYIKLSVTGDESQDVLTYRKINPVFPHHSTADQFFSESQFESYRRLGYHVGDVSFFLKTQGHNQQESVKAFFEDLYSSWQPIPRAIRDDFTKSNSIWDAFMQELQTSPGLARLANQLSGIASPTEEIVESNDDFTESWTFCVRLIQFMESVFFDLQLSSTLTHPAISGWKQQFTEWFGSPLLRKVYERKRLIYSKTFTIFCDREFPAPPCQHS